MPKTTKDFPAKLSVSVSESMKARLIAFSYLRGNGRMYAPTVKDFLESQMAQAYQTLTDRQKKDYDEILRNVEMQDLKSNKKAPA